MAARLFIVVTTESFGVGHLVRSDEIEGIGAAALAGQEDSSRLLQVRRVPLQLIQCHDFKRFFVRSC